MFPSLTRLKPIAIAYISVKPIVFGTVSHQSICGVSTSALCVPELSVGDDGASVVLVPGHVVPVVRRVSGGRAARAGAERAQALHLALEALAEGVVDEGVVNGGALGKHARQQCDLRREDGAVHQDVIQTHHAVGQPADDEASADQNGDLQAEGVGKSQWLLWY